jgi:tetratricopeptide (TPR) repeat protein
MTWHRAGIVAGLGAALAGVWPAAAPGQTVQYRAPGGAAYVSQPDTGAVARAEAALAAHPDSVDLMLALGLAQAGIRRYREAIATFTRAIERAPARAELYRWRGHRYLSVREFERARADLERGLTLDSACYGCLYHLGIVRYVTGDFAGAAEAFGRGLPLAPNAGETAGSIDWSWMALMRVGRPTDGQAVLDAHPNPAVDNAYTRRLRLYRGEIGPEGVVTSADTGDVDLATLSYGLGNWYLVRGDTAQAREWFARAVASGGWPAFGFIAAEVELRGAERR